MAYDDNPGDQNGLWSNYVAIPSSFANAGDTGLTTSKAYICWRVEDLDSLSEAQSVAATGSAKQIIFAIVKDFYDWITALATADTPANLTISQQSGGAALGTNATILHKLTTLHAASTNVAAE